MLSRNFGQNFSQIYFSRAEFSLPGTYYPTCLSPNFYRLEKFLKIKKKYIWIFTKSPIKAVHVVGQLNIACFFGGVDFYRVTPDTPHSPETGLVCVKFLIQIAHFNPGYMLFTPPPNPPDGKKRYFWVKPPEYIPDWKPVLNSGVSEFFMEGALFSLLTYCKPSIWNQNSEPI